MEVVQRRIGNQDYYYLKHSFRKGPQVITKEKYLGKDIPNDIEVIKSHFLEEINKQNLFSRFQKITMGFETEWKNYPASIKEKIKQQLAVDFTYNTNALENSSITLEETRELLEHHIAPPKQMRDIKETEAHARVFLAMLEKQQSIVPQILLDWHKELFGETKQDIAGKWREYRIRVANYVAPDWQDVPRLMKELLDWYAENKNLHPVFLAAQIHYRFEKIHPFGDGNGRIGRLLMNYVLWYFGFPILIIEYKKRKSYYHALTKTEDAFVHYFIQRYLKAHQRYLKNKSKDNQKENK